MYCQPTSAAQSTAHSFSSSQSFVSMGGRRWTSYSPLAVEMKAPQWHSFLSWALGEEGAVNICMESKVFCNAVRIDTDKVT